MPASTALRTMNDHFHASLMRVLSDMTDDQMLWCAVAVDARSIRDVAIHAYRALLAATTVVAEVAWPSKPVLPPTVPDLLSLLDAMHAQIDELLMHVPDDAWETTVTLPWAQQIGSLEALTGCLAHGFVHVGAIQGIRAIGGFPTPPEDPH